jgi:hypothetical protein
VPVGVTHWLLVQVCPDPQQIVPHRGTPPEQTHWLFTQLEPPEQTFPHVPQFALSLAVFAHAPPEH